MGGLSTPPLPNGDGGSESDRNVAYVTAAIEGRGLTSGRLEVTKMTTVSYRCSSCFDQTATRAYDVSHFSRSCPSCGEFARFVHGAVLAKVEEYEETPPAVLDWERLDWTEKLAVAEGIVRRGRTLDDFDVASVAAGSDD